jgi:hypothetical protein
VTTTETGGLYVDPQGCPSWCRHHDPQGIDDRVALEHVSAELEWTRSGRAAWIVRRGGQQPDEIVIWGDYESIDGISADEARRLAAVLVQLADALERG